MKVLLNLIIVLMGLVFIPMSYYNMYHILKAVEASDLMWFFFWFGLPVVIITTVLGKIVEMMKDKF